MIYARYTLLIHEPEVERSLENAVAQGEEIAHELPGFLREAEENLTVLLPYGYYATIEVKE